MDYEALYHRVCGGILASMWIGVFAIFMGWRSSGAVEPQRRCRVVPHGDPSENTVIATSDPVVNEAWI